MASPRMRAPQQYRKVHQLAFSPLFFQGAMAARDLGVLGAVCAAKQDGLNVAEVMQKAAVSKYVARVLLEGCLAMELVTLEGDRYKITDAGRLWLFDKMTIVNANFVRDVCYRGAARLEDSLRSGKAEGLSELGDFRSLYDGLTRLPPRAMESWLAFDHYYSDGTFPMVLPKVFEHAPRRLLDVGGNTGKWAMLCLSRDPNVEITVIDLPGQLEVLVQNVAAAGHADRLRTVAAELTDHDIQFPTGFDAVWMSQFLDCFGEDDVASLLRRGRAALAPGGRLYVMETFWDRQPNDVGELCLQGTSLYFTCIANGAGRMYHSNDLLELIAGAGLRVVGDEDLGLCHTLLTCVAAE